MTETLLQTKIRFPCTRPNFVPRPRLIEQLNQGVQMGCRLTLISAPAGFGKTTLLAEWVAQQEMAGAYLSLEEDDNDLKRFLAYFIAALQTIDPHLGEVVGAMLRSPETVVPDAALTVLINELAALTRPIFVILDDLHLIHLDVIYEALAYLLDHIPPSLHFVLATRADPPLPLAKLRGRGEMIELREAELRFSREETAQFLVHMMDLELGPGEVTILHERTEGWAAGLQMAALSMRGRERLVDFVQTFSGSHEYVVDYLTDEVLACQADDETLFLLQTSILDRLSGPLCDAVTGQQGGRERLEQLKAANLFINSLDDDRQWYCYHRLFADLLRQRLLNRQPDAVPELHRRASRWLEENGFAFEAIDHALQAEEYERAADLIEELIKRPAAWPLLNATTLMTWLDRLPDQLLFERPCLRLYQARIYVVQGQINKADGILQTLEQELRHGLSIKADCGNLLEQIAADRVSNAILQGAPRRAIDHAEQALDGLRPENLTARLRLEAILALASYEVGAVNHAAHAYTRAIAMAQTISAPVVIASLKTGLAKVNILRGRLREAAKDCEEAFRLAEVNHMQTPAAGPAVAAWSEVLTEQNELRQAAKLAAQSVALLLEHGPVHGLSTAYGVQARIQQARGQYEESFNSLRLAAQIAEGQPGGMLARRMLAQQTRLWLATGSLRAAVGWAKAYRRAAPIEYLGEFEELTLVRVLLAQERTDAALSSLETLLVEAEQAGRQGTVIEILVLQGLALAGKQKVDEALRPFSRSLALARPEGYARIFLDEGQPAAQLLFEAAAAGYEPEYARQLLETIPPVESGPEALIEPLSQRELQVLRLIEQGLTNRQIGQQLVISLPTVKSHTGHIYSKLGVSSRTQAVSKARALRIL